MRFGVFLALLLMADTCPTGTGSGPLPEGTWGGENAAVIVTDTAIHVHIGCTYGNAPRPVRLTSSRRFQVEGLHNITAHPVDRGVFHPAQFTGLVRGRALTLTVSLTDTTFTLGPVTVYLGQEPRMGPCPICRTPSMDRRR